MKNLVTNNPGLKISALLISILLWFFVTSTGQSEMVFEIPVEFKNIPAGLGIAGSSNRTATVNVRGQERLMKNIKASSIRVSVDLSKAKKGDGIFYVNKEDIKLPYNMTVSSVTPSSLKIKMDETVSAVVPVVPVITGRPARGFETWTVSVEPKNVAVHGLKTEMRKITDIKTEAFDITGLTETASQDVELLTPGANVRMDSNSAKITVAITGRKK
ncbi:MAG: hypothetical protein HZB33_13375 [Nitrospirae bacterium]|nr:hypothetical protein [Nitrospirota bacterium]